MQDIQSASLTKERILSTIKSKGPSLPIHLARAVNISPLFASAFLSELFGERKVKISNMRVGSSPLYYIEGQEPQLENFVEHLNHKEKEAFALLKQQKLLDDERQHPAIRVALRGLKDFAIQTKVNLDNKEKVFWKYFMLPDSELSSLLNTNKEEKREPKIEIKENIREKEPIKEKEIEKDSEIERIKDNIREIERSLSKTEIKTSVFEEERSKEKKKQLKEPKLKDQKFLESVKKHLQSKNVEFLEAIEIKNKEFTAKIKLNTLFGEQEYYLIAKEKKKLTEEELITALHKAQENKMPALLMIPGDIDKKAQQFLNSWRNLIKFEKLKT